VVDHHLQQALDATGPDEHKALVAAYARLLGHRISPEAAAGIGGETQAHATTAEITVFLSAHVEEDRKRASTNRELREAAAKARILSRHRQPAPDSRWARSASDCCAGCGFVDSGPLERPATPDIDRCPELRDLASVYEGAAGYLPRWSEAGQ
jgi:hypothetical protein